METQSQDQAAFGKPGIEPRWTRGNKDAVGTAYSASSRVWFTLSAGILNEVYFPTIDRPQIRDLRLLVNDGKSFFHDERHLDSTVRALSPHALGYEIINADRQQLYQIVKQVIADPHQACVLMHTRLEAEESTRDDLRLFALLAPHLGVGGWGNSSHVFEIKGREILVANKGDLWLAMAATFHFARRSCGYVGASDGWTDLVDNFQMDWQFDAAEDGNIALTGQFDVEQEREFTLGLAFGYGRHNAVTTLVASLGISFAEHRDRFLGQWKRACEKRHPLKNLRPQSEQLYRNSHSLLLAHEDKTHPGAMIASLSIFWGEARGDDDIGGYHLVWTRDLVVSVGRHGHTATGARLSRLLAAFRWGLLSEFLDQRRTLLARHSTR